MPGTTFEHLKSAAGQAWREVRKIGTTVHGIDTAKIGFETAIEAGEGRAAKGPKPTPFEAPEHRTAPATHPAPTEPPVETVVKAPPTRVWNEGLRDIDVMRWLGDSSGVQDILRLRGREFFGSRTWDRMESLARNTTDHAQLASHFGSATRGEEITTPSPGRRLLVSDGGVKVNLKVLQLEYDRTDGKVELSPSNATSTTSTKTRLDWSLWGGQVQGGVKTDVVGAEGTFQVGVGGSHRSREGLSAGNSGQVVSHAKFNTPMARYDGFAEVEVVFFKGDKEVVEKGVIPITIDIPERETVDAKVMSDHYLTFSEDSPNGLAAPKHPAPKPAPEATPEAAPAPKPEAAAESVPKPEAVPESKPVPKPEATPEAKPHTEPEPKPEAEPEAKPDHVGKAAEDVFNSPQPGPSSVPEPTPGHPKLSDLMPESSWWRLFIDANVHEAALVNSPGDAANHMDVTKYPGFRQGMTELFREVLDGGSGGRDWSRIDKKAYEEIHELATRHLVEGSGKNVATVWSGTGEGTLTTMRGTGRTNMASDVADERIGGHKLVADFTSGVPQREEKTPLVLFTRGQAREGMISINYPHGSAPDHVQNALDRYYAEVGAATDDRGKLLAIAKVTRALQMIQPFTDANSRVNVSVLLQKFLIEQGFRPTVLTNSFELFLGGYTTHEIADHLVEGMARFDKLVAGAAGDLFNTAAGPADHVIAQFAGALGLSAGDLPGDAAVVHHQVLDAVRLDRSIHGDGAPTLDAAGVHQLRAVRHLADLANEKFPGLPTTTAVASYANHLHGGPEGVTAEHLRTSADAVGDVLKEGLPLTEENIKAKLRPVAPPDLLSDAELRAFRGADLDEPAPAPTPGPPPTGPSGGKVSWEALAYEAPDDGRAPKQFDVYELSGGEPLTADGLAEKLMPKVSDQDLGSFRLVLRAEHGSLGDDPIRVAQQTADMFMAPIDLLLADDKGAVHLVSFDDSGRHGAPQPLELNHPAGTPWESLTYEAPKDGRTPTSFDVHELSGGEPLTADELMNTLMPKLSGLDLGSFRLVLRAEDGSLGPDPIRVAQQTADMFMAPIDLLLADGKGAVHLVSFDDFGRHTPPQLLETNRRTTETHRPPTPEPTAGPAPRPEHPAADAPSHQPESTVQPEPHPQPEHQPEHAEAPPHPQPEHPVAETPPHPQSEPHPRPERVHEIVDALVHAHEGSDVRWLADPDSPAGQLHGTGRAVARFPKDSRFFSVAFHSEHADGAPTWRGERVSPEELAGVLAELRARGIWEEGKPLQFPACEFGTGKASSYAAEVLKALRGKVSGPLEAYVPEGKLWFVPKPTGAFTVESEGPGHLVVAKTVGFDANGLPVVVPGGRWLKVSLPEASAEHPEHPEHPQQPGPPQHEAGPQVEELGAHLPTDPSAPVSHDGLPEGLHWAPESSVVHEMPGATAFGKRAIYDTPDYATATADFEKALGSYCHNLPEAEDAARRTVAKLLYVIQKANPEVSALDRVKAILKDDSTSAGQVGTDLTPQQIAGLLKQGNTRELMTAFFNGAYFNDSELNLKKLFNSIIEKEDWARAEQLGLNVDALKEHHAFLEGPLRKGLHESLSKVSPKHATMFEHDVFGTGNVLAQSKTWFSDGKSYLTSISARTPRPENELRAPSALQLDLAGVKLSERELAFLKVNPLAWDVVGLRVEGVPWEDVPRKADGSYDLEALKTQPGVHDVFVERGPHGEAAYKLVEHRPNPELGPGEIAPDKPVSWRTGEGVHKLSPESSWYKEANGGMGMRLVAGISATSAKLMTAFKLLNVEGVDPDHMVKALFGWMLPTGDHSVYEILKGVEMSGATKPLTEDALRSAEDMYRNLPGITIDQVRRDVSPDHMLPHEQVYVSKIKEQNGGFGEPAGPHRSLIEERMSIFDQIARGSIDPHADEDVVDGVSAWLATNHMTAQEVLKKLTPAHFYALAAYTGPAFPLINVMMRFGESFDKPMLVQIKNLLWGSGTTPTSLSFHPAIKDLLRQHSGIKSVEMANRRKIMEIVQKEVLPDIKAEMREHARMLESALELLPPAEGRVYRGAAALSVNGFTGLSPAYGGSHFRSSDFASTSRSEATAVRFRDNRRKILGTEPVLVTMELTGGGAAKDISAFSVEMQEREVLGKPGSEYTMLQKRRKDGNLFIDVKEANSATSFPMPGTPGTPGTPATPKSAAALRQSRTELQEHLADMSGLRGIKEHKDLWALGKEIGVSNADGVRGWSGAHAFPTEKAKQIMGERTWHIGTLTADLHGGASRVDIDRLRRVRRVTDVVREALKLKSEQPVAKAELDSYLRRLNKSEDTAKVVPVDRHRLVKLVNSLKKQGSHVSASDVAKAWTPLPPGTPRTVGTPGGGHLTPTTPHTPGTPLTPTGHQIEQPGGHNPPGDLRRQRVVVFGAAPTMELHHQKQAAMQHFPLDDRFLTVAMHTSGGFPVHVNVLMAPEEVAVGLHREWVEGRWDGQKALQFVACNLGQGIESSYVAQVMAKLWSLDPAIVAPAYASDGPVWFVPKVDAHGVPDFGLRGDLVVAGRVGMTKNARPGISAGGSWYRLDRPTDGTLVPVVEKLGSYLRPDGDSEDRPEHYLGAANDEFDDTKPIPGAIPFDSDQSESDLGLADQIFQELMK
ncbi:hypothetical protein ACGF12_22310 [Kitasatospora sp. NPDC048296]|uniref:hypothetical protein n=1 Tax=Kitasatospora sp. NPDC048296 TaxID=3364048 RepID=UPI0037130E62